MAEREDAMVVLRRHPSGRPAVWCDPDIADVVQALNAGGVPTVASCSGHGVRPGNVALADGRELIVAADWNEAREVEAAFLRVCDQEVRVDGECQTAHELSPFPRAPAEYEVWLSGRWLPYCGLCARAFHADLPRRPLSEGAEDGR